MTQKKLTILGSTGSIGTQTLAIVRTHPNYFSVHALSAGNNLALFKEQLLEFRPTIACISDPSTKDALGSWLKQTSLTTQLVAGSDGLASLAKENVDLCVIALSGTIGILPTYTAIMHRNPVALACKEALVSAGDIIMAAVHEQGTPLIPVDSEHAAIAQCLSRSQALNDIHCITLTASGGPFWNYTASDYAHISSADALNHPTWKMGKKITIDSATLVNKALEVIEAHHLFHIPFSKLDAIVHRQSIVHAIIDFNDGNCLAHLSPTDMSFPIQYALSYPTILPTPKARLSLTKTPALTFEPINHKRFPLFKLGLECGEKKGNYPIVFNAANEVLVHTFLNNQLPFNQLEPTLRNYLDALSPTTPHTITDIINIDTQTKHDIIQTFKL